MADTAAVQYSQILQRVTKSRDNGLRPNRPYGRVPALFEIFRERLKMAQEEQGFVIRDRRASGGAEAAQTSSSPATEAKSSAAAPTAPSQTPPAPPVSFSSFVISLGSSSLMLMGEQLDPHQAPIPVNLPQAKEIIDLLSVLEDKTKGNLASDEQTVLRDMLYALRMKYVTLASPK
jgi:hypothetical protein